MIYYCRVWVLYPWAEVLFYNRQLGQFRLCLSGLVRILLCFPEESRSLLCLIQAIDTFWVFRLLFFDTIHPRKKGMSFDQVRYAELDMRLDPAWPKVRVGFVPVKFWLMLSRARFMFWPSSLNFDTLGL